MQTVNEQIADRIIAHAIGLQRLEKGTARRVLNELAALDAALERQLRDASLETLSRTRLNKLLAAVKRTIGENFTAATNILQLDLNKLASLETDFQVNLIEDVLPFEWDTVVPDPKQVIAAVNDRPFDGRLMQDVFRDLPATTFRDVQRSIRSGVVEGRATEQIVKEIFDGPIEKSRRNVRTVVRTATNHTANAAREVTYEANDDIIKAVQWVSTLDGRTSAVCQARDGKTYEPGEGPRPPAHFNCRSTTIPITKSYRELGFDIDELPPGTRASMNGQVPANQDYDAWLRKQPTEFQDEVLGREKAEIFRTGVKVDKFVDASGRELTVDQIRRNENIKPRKPTPPKPTPKAAKASIWDGKSAVEREKVAPAFAKADPRRMAVVERYGALKTVKSGRGSYNSADGYTIQMDKDLSPDAYNRVMRHEYGHHIDAMFEKDRRPTIANGHYWGAKPVPGNMDAFRRKNLALDGIEDTLKAADDVDEAIQAEFVAREMDYFEARSIFHRTFASTNDSAVMASIKDRKVRDNIKIGEAAEFLASFDVGDHVSLVHNNAKTAIKASPLAGLSDTLGALTNQRIGYAFGHKRTYYSKFRSHDKAVARSRVGALYKEADLPSIVPTTGKYAYGTGNSAQAFANWFEAWTSGNQTQYMIFKRLFPDTSRKFEQIVERELKR